MKVEAQKAPKTFEPFTLTITFETKNELMDMLVRHLATNKDMSEVIRSDGGDWVVGQVAAIAAVNSISDDWSGVPLLQALRPFVEALS